MATIRKREWVHEGEARTAWVVEYTDQSGKRRRATPPGGKRKDADALRRKIEREMEVGAHVAASETITVDRALDLFLANMGDRVRNRDGMRRMTLYNCRSLIDNHLRPRWGSMKLTQITPSNFQAFLNDMASVKGRPYTSKPYSKAMLERVASLMRLTLSHAQMLGFIGRNVLREADIRIPGTPYLTLAIPTKEEITRILSAAQGDLKPMLHLAVFTGLRQGELRALTWDHIDFAKRVIRVRQAADARGGVDEPKTPAAIRDVPLSQQTLSMMQAWRTLCPPSPGNLVFASTTARIRTTATVHVQWVRLLVALKLTDEKGKGRYHFHALRHVAASLLIESGLPPKRIQSIMGHSSIKLTFDRYGHLFEDQDLVNAAMDRIGNALLPAGPMEAKPVHPPLSRDNGAIFSDKSLISMH